MQHLKLAYYEIISVVLTNRHVEIFERITISVQMCNVLNSVLLGAGQMIIEKFS